MKRQADKTSFANTKGQNNAAVVVAAVAAAAAAAAAEETPAAEVRVQAVEEVEPTAAERRVAVAAGNAVENRDGQRADEGCSDEQAPVEAVALAAAGTDAAVEHKGYVAEVVVDRHTRLQAEQF
jgi:outer membrane protein assembly factor BamA